MSSFSRKLFRICWDIKALVFVGLFQLIQLGRNLSTLQKIYNNKMWKWFLGTDFMVWNILLYDILVFPISTWKCEKTLSFCDYLCDKNKSLHILKLSSQKSFTLFKFYLYCCIFTRKYCKVLKDKIMLREKVERLTAAVVC